MRQGSWQRCAVVIGIPSRCRVGRCSIKDRWRSTVRSDSEGPWGHQFLVRPCMRVFNIAIVIVVLLIVIIFICFIVRLVPIFSIGSRRCCRATRNAVSSHSALIDAAALGFGFGSAVDPIIRGVLMITLPRPFVASTVVIIIVSIFVVIIIIIIIIADLNQGFVL